MMLSIISFSLGSLHAQQQSQGYDKSFFKALQWRSIGPYRGGRVTAVVALLLTDESLRSALLIIRMVLFGFMANLLGLLTKRSCD